MCQIQGGPGKRNRDALAGSKFEQTRRILSGKLGLGVVPIRGRTQGLWELKLPADLGAEKGS